LALAKLTKNLFCDRLSHNSLISGASLSQARFARYKHNDLADLEKKLSAWKTPQNDGWIITESVFGMDGDLADLSGLLALSQRVGLRLFIDEAHATGVFGDNGMGRAQANGRTSLIMGTFGKGLGSFGAYVACSKQLKDYLVNFCPGFIYTTALPPPVLGAIDAALEIIPTMMDKRTHLLSLADYARDRLKTLGYNVGSSQSQIIPIILGDDHLAISLAQHLEDNQLFAPAIRPPTVPSGTARLRLSFSALHTEEHLDKLFAALKKWQPPQARNCKSPTRS